MFVFLLTIDEQEVLGAPAISSWFHLLSSHYEALQEEADAAHQRLERELSRSQKRAAETDKLDEQVRILEAELNRARKLLEEAERGSDLERELLKARGERALQHERVRGEAKKWKRYYYEKYSRKLKKVREFCCCAAGPREAGTKRGRPRGPHERKRPCDTGHV